MRKAHQLPFAIRKIVNMPDQIETIPVESVEKYLKLTTKRHKRWKSENGRQSHAWFRGVTDADYSLAPTFHRFPNQSLRLSVKMDCEMGL